MSSAGPALSTSALSNVSNLVAQKIAVRVFQNKPGQFSHLVEKTVTWQHVDGCFWQQLQVNDQHLLTFGGDATSGCLRFISEDGKEQLIKVRLRIHNNEHWVRHHSQPHQRAVINAKYHSGDYNKVAKEKLRTIYSVTNYQCRKFTVEFIVVDGKTLRSALND